MKDRPTLCEGCHHGVVMQRLGGDTAAHCRLLNRPVPTDLTSCNRRAPLSGTLLHGVDMPVPQAILIDARRVVTGVYM